MKQWSYYAGVMALAIALLAGCNTNIRHINNDISCPVDYRYEAPYDQTWSATLEAVRQFSTIATLDQQSGYITTNIATVDGREMNMADHALFGMTYKFAYDIRLVPAEAGTTLVSTRVKLFYEQFMGLSRREGSIAKVEHYLRYKLYREICGRLFPDGGSQCSSDFANPRFDQRPEAASVSSPANADTGGASSSRAVSTHSIDTRLQTAQHILHAGGYRTGPIDGVMGRKTKGAIEAFQRDNGLAVTGTLDDETYALLTSGNWAPAAPADGQPNKLPEEPQAIVPPPDQREAAPVPPATVPKRTAGSYVTADTAYLLEEADLYGAKVIGTVPANTVIKVISRDGDYYRVAYQGKEGYIYNSFVTEN